MIICPWKDIKKYAALLPGVDEAVEAVNALTEYENKKAYPLSNEGRFTVSVNTTKAPDVAEAHRKYLDIQYIVKGKEMVGWADLADCQIEGEFNEAKDLFFDSGTSEIYTINEGMCYVVFPEDVHMPGRHLEVPSEYTKIIIKLAV